MKKFPLLAMLMFMGSCASPVKLVNTETPEQTPATEQKDNDTKSDKSDTDTTTCNYWEIGCKQAPPGPVVVDNPHDFDSSSDGYTDENGEYIPTMAELLVGSWSGEYQWDLSSKRLLYISFTKWSEDEEYYTYYTKNGGTMEFIINPYGPNRIDWSGYWEIDNENILRLYDYKHNLQYIWHDLKIVPGKYFTFTGSNQDGIVKMTSGLTIPEEGLVAEVFVFSTTQKDDVFLSTGMLWWDRLYFDGILLMARQQSPNPICSDWTYGVTQINMDGGQTFNIGQIPGFDRYGGSKCKNYSDRFVLDLYGAINIPAGRTSNIRFNTASKEVDDGAIVFIDDYNHKGSVLSDMTEENAVLCNAKSYDIICSNKSKSPLNYTINAGTTGGWLPFELIYVELDKNVYLNIELSLSSNNNYAPISPKRLTYPIDWRD